MLATLFATVVLAQGTAAAQEQVPPVHPGMTAVQIVEKVLAHYSNATSISGLVNMKQTAGGAEVRIDTQLQYQKPSKIFLRQVKSGQEGKSWLLVSDGKVFAYDPPSGVLGRDRFKEYVTQNQRSQTVREMYAVERFSLADPSPMLDIAIGRTEDLGALMGQWASMKVHGPAKANGQDTTAIIGSYVDKPGEQATGTFEAYFNKDFDFVRYVLKQRLNIKLPNENPRTVDIVSIWDSTLKVNATPNEGLFKVVG